MKKELTKKDDVYDFSSQSTKLPLSVVSMKKENGGLFILKTLQDNGDSVTVTGTEINYKTFTAKVKI